MWVINGHDRAETGLPKCPREQTFTVLAACLERAKAQSRCAPARCAGARAERPVASLEDSGSSGEPLS